MYIRRSEYFPARKRPSNVNIVVNLQIFFLVNFNSIQKFLCMCGVFAVLQEKSETEATAGQGTPSRWLLGNNDAVGDGGGGAGWQRA
jgi:hypothetical protein